MPKDLYSIPMEELQKAAKDYFEKAYNKEERTFKVVTNAAGEEAIHKAMQEKAEKELKELSAGDLLWQQYKKTKEEKKKDKKSSKKGASGDIELVEDGLTGWIEEDKPKPEPNIQSCGVYYPSTSNYEWRPAYPSFDTTIRIDKEEYDQLKANQKPKEWSDDVVLIDINKLTAWLLDDVAGLHSAQWYEGHKENKLSDKEFEIWDKQYETILNFRSNEQ